MHRRPALDVVHALSPFAKHSRGPSAFRQPFGFPRNVVCGYILGRMPTEWARGSNRKSLQLFLTPLEGVCGT
jgi:hypothetical protein